MNTIEVEIKKSLESMRPLLALHKGDIDFVGFEASSGTVQVRLKGACHACPMSELTLKAGVEKMLRRRVPEVLRVESQSGSHNAIRGV